MLSKAQIKYIRSLSQQKYRKEQKVFIAEGDKIVREWLDAGGHINIIVAVSDWAQRYNSLLNKHPEADIIIVKEHELAAISSLQSPNGVLAVVPVPERQTPAPINEWCIALDGLQDPGNMGTIIRIADWFGISHIHCSPDCVDVYNPKVVQAAMGGHLRVNIFSADLNEVLKNTTIPILAATLDGISVYNQDKKDAAVLVIGNESKGISERIAALATQKVFIPRYGGAESLNAGVSAGILCALLVQR